MDPKLHPSSPSPKGKSRQVIPQSPQPRSGSPPPRNVLATPPRSTLSADSPLRRVVGASPRTNLSPKPPTPLESLVVPPIHEKARKRPLSKTKSFVFSKSFDETKQFKNSNSVGNVSARDSLIGSSTSVWSPSQSSNRNNTNANIRSPSDSLTSRQSFDEAHETVEELQVKLKKNSIWKDQYADLKRLHDLIGKIKKDYLHAEQEFATALAAQVTKVEMFFRRLVSELQQTDKVFQIAYEPKELARFIQDIEDFALLNTAILKNVVYIHDLNSVLRLKPSYAWTIRRDDFCQPALLFPLFVQLSHTYHPTASPPQVPITPAFRRTVPPSNQRFLTGNLSNHNTTSNSKGIKVSVWIPHNQVVSFIIKVLSHMPIYDPEMFAIPHTAVYFDDSEMKGFQAYVSPSSSGSPSSSSSPSSGELTCLRWMSVPPATMQVYIDQKKVEAGRHTTKQIGILPHSLIGAFIKNSHKDSNSTQNHSEEVGEQENRELKHHFEDNPGLINLQKQMSGLRPTLKVEHFRTWFGNESLKIKLCTQLTILRELDQTQLNKLNEWTTPSERIQEQRIHRFPFALVSVHSQSLVLPQWLSETVDKYDRQDKFSTYPHGIAMLYEKVTNQYGRPSWLSGSLANVFLKPLTQDEKTKEQTVAGYFKHSRSEMQMQFRTTELHRLRSHSVSEYMRTGSVDFSSPGGNNSSSNNYNSNNFEPRTSDLTVYRSKQPAFRGGDQSMLPLITRTDALVQPSPERERDEKREQEPEGRPLLPRRTEAGGEGGGGGSKPVRKSIGDKKDSILQTALGKRAVESKTYFANERTYMQWFNAAILLSTVGLALLNSLHYFLRIVAYCFPVMAILVLIYAYRMYRIRIRTLDLQLPTDKFADMQGPCCLTSIVSILFVTVIILMAIRDTQPPLPLYLPNAAGLRLLNAGVVAIECDPGFAFPSPMKGLAYNGSTQELWGVSDSQIFQLRTDTGITYRYFPQDSVLHVGMLGVAVSDKPSRLYIGKQIGAVLSVDTSTKKVVDNWRLNGVYSLSAFTFIPGSGNNASGYFYVANTLNDAVDVFAVPLITATFLEKQTSFVPIPGVRSISALAFLPNMGLLINSLAPKALVLYGIQAGLPTSVVRVLSGFDVKNVVAITRYSDTQTLVQSGNSSKVLLYRLDSTLSTYADCLKTR